MTPLSRCLALLAALASLPAMSFNHDTVVPPIAPGRFAVACSHFAVDTARLAALGGNASDYWEGKMVNGVQRYATDILANPSAAVHFDAAVPDQRNLYTQFAGGLVPYVAIVCHPTPRSNADPDYVLPGGTEVLPHMQAAGAPPKLISNVEFLQGFGIEFSPPPALMPQPLPLIVYSHGLGGSPVGTGYVQAMVELAANGFIVVAPFHGDARFSRIRIEDFSGFIYFLTNFDRVVEMQAMRPLSLKAATDLVLGSAWAPAVDTTRIAGFGASLGGEAMAHLLGARITATLGLHCEETVRDPRLRAAVGYVPYAGQSFLPAFCDDQQGADDVNKPYLAISGTADITAPIGMMEQAVNRFGSSRYLVQLAGGEHELRPEDVGDLFTWMVTFYNAYLQVPWDTGAMGRFIRMGGVTGGREDSLRVDVHVPFTALPTETVALEFYNTDLQHYFMAASAGEIANILNGGAGRGWELTGEAFKAWPTMPTAVPAPVVPVCRFYGVPAGGPNSHFFTADATECEIVKRNGGWFYEGVGFYARPPQGGCLFGELQVNRAYNNGFPRNDSNHRFSTSDSTMREMARKGWTVEGTVMCAKP